MAAKEQLVVITAAGGVEWSDEMIDAAVYRVLGIEPPKTSDFFWQLVKRAYGPRIFPDSERQQLIANKPLVRKVVRAVVGGRTSLLVPGLVFISKEQADEENLRTVDGSIASDLVYCRHPLAPSLLIPMANFHDYLLQEKRSEFFRLAVALGARSIKLVSSEKAASSSRVELGATVPVEGAAVDIGAKGGHQLTTGEGFSLDGEFSAPRRLPFLPDDLVWFGREPLWKTMAFARQESWASNYNISLVYTQDFGVTAELAAKVAGFGFSAGGSFRQMTEVRQTYRVDFFGRDDFDSSDEQAR